MVRRFRTSGRYIYRVPKQPKVADGKRCSLIQEFEEALSIQGSLGGPEPDFMKWLDSLLFAETGNACDYSIDKKLGEEERNGWRTFHDAVSRTHDLLQLRQRDPALFRKIASRFSVLPCFMSRHPSAAAFNRELLTTSDLGMESLFCEQARHAGHYAHQCWPVRYAYALIFTIDVTMDTWADLLPDYAAQYGYGIPHPIDSAEIEAVLSAGSYTAKQKVQFRRKYENAYRIIPAWARTLQSVCRPLCPNSVIDYWRKGKEIISEELPDFDLRPEWASYRGRTYPRGAKRGSIRHAIFKDILTAFRTIAGGQQLSSSSKLGKTTA